MAKKTITQRIALEGGEAIKAQLKALGDVGERAFQRIQAAAVKAEFSKFAASAKAFGSDLQTVFNRVALGFGVVATAAAAVGVAVGKVAKHGADMADEAGKAAQAAGLAVGEFGRLAFAADQSGVSTEELNGGLSRLNRTIAEAADGSKPAIKAFKDIGVSFKDADGKMRPASAIIADIADRFASMPDGVQKSALAMDLFGRSGAQLIPMLNGGSRGLRELGAQAERLGIVFSDKQFRIAEVMNDTLSELRTAVSGIMAQLGLLFAPVITEGAAALRDLLIQNKDAIINLGRAAVGSGIGVLLDLMNLLRGNDAAVSRPWILAWRDAVVTFGRELAAVVTGVILPMFRAIHAAAAVVADGINAVFGTKLTGGELLIAAALLKLLGIFTAIASGATLVVSALRLVGTVVAALFGPSVIAAATSFWGVLARGAALVLPALGALVSWPALLVAAVVAAGVAIFAFWDEIKAGASATWQFLTRLFSAEGFNAAFAGLGSGLNAVWDGVKAGASAAWQAIGAGAAALPGLIAAAFTGIAQIVGAVWSTILQTAGVAWDGVVSAALAAWDGIVAAAQSVGARLEPVWAAIATAATGVWNGIAVAASSLWDSVVSVFTGAAVTVGQAVGAVANAAVAAWTTATTAIVEAARSIGAAILEAQTLAGDAAGAADIAVRLVAPFLDARDQIAGVMAEIGAAATDGVTAAVDSAGEAATGIAQHAVAAIDGIARRLSNFSGAVRQAFAGVVAALRAQFDALAASVSSLISRLSAQLAALRAQIAAARAAAAGAGAQRNAAGGHIVGAGTGTSDSILSWLSNGEFVIRAASVKKFGVAFFNMLNQGVMPDLKKLRGFNMGGLATAFSMPDMRLNIPRFAEGGLASVPAAAVSGVPIILQLGDQRIGTVMAPAEVAQALGRYAGERQLASLGRRPSWDKG